VVIPTYNRRELALRRCNRCWISRCADIEVIVVDDASVDGTADFLRHVMQPIRA